MAATISIESKSTTYEDLPLTSFPVTEDNWKRMSDINLILMPLVTKFNEYYKAGNLSACNKLISDNPDLLDCFFNAEKWNQLRDAVLALERYYLEEVEQFIFTVAQNALGINDNPTEEQLSVTTYSSGRINTIVSEIYVQINKIQNSVIITLSASGWSDSAPYSQRISVPKIRANDEPGVYAWTPKTLTTEATKLQRKMAGLITSGETEDGYITLYCGYKKPTVDFQVILKGVNN